MAGQEDKAAVGRGIFGRPIPGTPILGAPELERGQGNTEERPQATEEGSRAAEGRNTAGRPILGVGRAIPGMYILGTPKI